MTMKMNRALPYRDFPQPITIGWGIFGFSGEFSAVSTPSRQMNFLTKNQKT
jgi:hypothetical protein